MNRYQGFVLQLALMCVVVVCVEKFPSWTGAFIGLGCAIAFNIGILVKRDRP